MSLFDSNDDIAKTMNLPPERRLPAILIDSANYLKQNTYEKSESFGQWKSTERLLFQVFDKGASWLVMSKDLNASLEYPQSGLSKFFLSIMPKGYTIQTFVKSFFDGKFTNLAYNKNSEGRFLSCFVDIEYVVAEATGVPRFATIKGFSVYNLEEDPELIPNPDQFRDFSLIETLKLNLLAEPANGVLYIMPSRKKETDNKEAPTPGNNM